jgi:hypothetical protein
MRAVSMHLHRSAAARALTFAALLVASPVEAADPVLLSVYQPGGAGLYYDAQLVGDILYVPAFDVFLVVDVSDPAQLSTLATHPSLGFAAFVEVVGDRAYIGHGSGEIEVLSIANPTAPTVLGTWVPAEPNYVRRLEVVGDLVYFVTQGGGFRIVDVSALPAIVEVGSFEPPEELGSVAIFGDYAYLAAEQACSSSTSLTRCYRTTSLPWPDRQSTTSRAGISMPVVAAISGSSILRTRPLPCSSARRRSRSRESEACGWTKGRALPTPDVS